MKNEIVLQQIPTLHEFIDRLYRKCLSILTLSPMMRILETVPNRSITSCSSLVVLHSCNTQVLLGSSNRDTLIKQHIHLLEDIHCAPLNVSMNPKACEVFSHMFCENHTLSFATQCMFLHYWHKKAIQIIRMQTVTK